MAFDQDFAVAFLSSKVLEVFGSMIFNGADRLLPFFPSKPQPRFFAALLFFRLSFPKGIRFVSVVAENSGGWILDLFDFFRFPLEACSRGSG